MHLGGQYFDLTFFIKGSENNLVKIPKGRKVETVYLKNQK